MSLITTRMLLGCCIRRHWVAFAMVGLVSPSLGCIRHGWVVFVAIGLGWVLDTPWLGIFTAFGHLLAVVGLHSLWLGRIRRR